MNKIFILTLGLVFGCGTKVVIDTTSPEQRALQGEHELRRLSASTFNSTKASGSFFMFVGDFSLKQTEQVKVMFSWKTNDGTYTISTLPVEQIRIKIDSTKDKPTVKFKWRETKKDLNYTALHDIVRHRVIYALITCKEEDWPENVNLNSLP